MQVGSIIYKGISYTKEGTTVSTKPNPQEGSKGWGDNLAGADTPGGAAHTPPLKVVHCKTELSHFTFGFAVSVGKTQNNCNKKTTAAPRGSPY